MPERNWGAASGEYVRELEPASDSLSWTLVLQGGESPGEVRLLFRGGEGLPPDTHLRVGDPQGRWEREVMPGGEIAIAATASPRTLRFRAVRDGSSGPVTGAETWSVYPNPFTGRAAVVFNLATPRSARIVIYDVAGRRVRQLVQPQAEAGENVLVWDGRDDEGRNTQAGIYFARYLAGPSRGVLRLIRLR